MNSTFNHGKIILLIINLSLAACLADETTPNDTLRIALFNIWEMSTDKLTDTDVAGKGQYDQLKAAAEIIRRIRPDVLVINEIDHDIDALISGSDHSLNARRFNDAYLNQGERPVNFQFTYAAPCNTGFLAKKDFDNNGKVATDQDQGSRDHGGDCYGWGEYPGQYSMAILSNLPLEQERARTFQKFLWKDLPDNLIPAEWYSEDEIGIFRLSSKSHWDVPVNVGTKNIHLLVSHPTPPVFDGPEDRNGRRNFDELKMWVHYINNDSVMVDDSGIRGGLEENKSFIVLGDLNAGPQGDKLQTGQRSIDQLLKHPRINDRGDLLVSEGALMGQPPGPPEYFERRTSGWEGRGRRIDHILPSKDLNIVDGGVYWPDAASDSVGAALAKEASDHRLVWIDIIVK